MVVLRVRGGDWPYQVRKLANLVSARRVSMSSSKQYRATILLVSQVDLDIAQMVVMVELVFELPEWELQLAAQAMMAMVSMVLAAGPLWG